MRRKLFDNFIIGSGDVFRSSPWKCRCLGAKAKQIDPSFNSFFTVKKELYVPRCFKHWQWEHFRIRPSPLLWFTWTISCTNCSINTLHEFTEQSWLSVQNVRTLSDTFHLWVPGSKSDSKHSAAKTQIKLTGLFKELWFPSSSVLSVGPEPDLELQRLDEDRLQRILFKSVPM